MNIDKEFKIITNHYYKLIEQTKKHLFVGTLNEWIVDNYYLLIELRDNVKNFYKYDKKRKKYILNEDYRSIIKYILEKTNYRLDPSILLKELKEYQDKFEYYLSYDEIAILSVIISEYLIKKTSLVCFEQSKLLEDKKEIDNIIYRLKRDVKKKKNINLSNYLDVSKYSNVCIAYFNDQLKTVDCKSNDIFRQLNKNLVIDKRAFSKLIDNANIEETKDNILIANIFYSVKKLETIKVEILNQRLSKVEAILKQDKYFSKMENGTKELYRNKINRYAEKHKITQSEYAYQLLSKNIHIGFNMFKNESTFWGPFFYVFAIISLSLTFSYILSNIFIPSRILGTILLFIPFTEVFVFLINMILQMIFKPQALPRMDFSKGIPSTCKTMVVIPTIIKNKEKVESVFDSLEKYYLSNKSNNLYFTLLGDCSSSSTKRAKHDDEVKEAGLEKAKALNKKYGKEIFFFAYRNRKYSDGEGCYLGFERKRGALLEFNHLLAGKLSEEDKEEYYYCHSFNKFDEKIKYVITLDVDTQLVLNSGINLVSIMEHPLNKPVLNKEGTKVIKGYAIIQPNVTIDIDCTNKSLFSQIYAGVGGYDPYTNPSPSLYQDLFKEGAFCGKGIYNLEICNQVLENTFPNNLILSHDLLEGNYLRCGNATDIELVDDFPSSFVADAARRSRWARGDMQVTPWIFAIVKNKDNKKVKNPLTFLERWKIVDNIRRGLVDLSLLIIILMSIGINNKYTSHFITFVYLVILLPVITYIVRKLKIRSRDELKVFRYYSNLSYGLIAMLYKFLSILTSIPYNAYLYTTSFIKALYRMNISHKNLLNWITAEEAEKNSDNSLKGMIKSYKFNFVINILIFILMIINGFNLYGFLMILCFTFGPIFAYQISKDTKEDSDKVTNKEKENLRELAYRTWMFFDENMNDDNHYLIPDNYQLNREDKLDYKTSPTNIGFSLTSIIAAYELDFISERETIRRLEKVINTISKLPKWHGHLYNWYNVKTLEVLNPPYVSTVDSGNFVASLVMTKEFLSKIGNKKYTIIVENLIKKTNFKYLYTGDNVFSIGFNVNEGRLDPYNYNKFASESRISSFVAISKGDVDMRHWFNLDKTLTAYKHRKGLVSWSGTSFEYFMPLLYFKTFPNTLIDESYYFCIYAQKKYISEVDKDLPWGVSESAYNELDDAQNYKYKAFSVPYLKLREDPASRVVVAPYASIIALPKFPKDVINNLKKWEHYNMEGRYGYYESYDVDDKKQVFTFFAHHQGMILASITNYLTNSRLVDYFESDMNTKAYNLLNKEKVQIKPMINMKMMKYKKYTYDKEGYHNDIRVYNKLSTLPEISILSNSKYTTIINDRGNGISKYRETYLNRYRKITEQDYGMFMYIKDLKNNHVWSNTYSPINEKPDKYEVVYALDRIKFVRHDQGMVTVTQIVTTKMHNAEIRKVTIKNITDKSKLLELTTYNESILCSNSDDMSHQAFNNFFIESEYDKATNSLIMKRKNNATNEVNYMVNRLLIEKPMHYYEFETNRNNFIGRNHTTQNPVGLDKELSCTAGLALDPIMSLRNTIKVDPMKEINVYFIIGYGKSKDQVLDIVNVYDNAKDIEEKAFETSTVMSNVTTKMVNITGEDMRNYNTLINYLYQTSRIAINEERQELIKDNVLSQEGLWKYGISGDHPMVLVDIKSIEKLGIVKELLHMFEYYKSKSIFIDLIILNCKDDKEAGLAAKEIDEEKYHMYALNSFNKTPGNIYIIDRKHVTDDEIRLLYTVSRISVDTDKYFSLNSYIRELQEKNLPSTDPKFTNVICEKKLSDEKLEFKTDFGGFANNGTEYQILTKDTPLAWSNIIGNKCFGTIITNNHCGYTYAKNSREFKLTCWTNDSLICDQSEGFKFNNLNLNFETCKHGFGYTTFTGTHEKFDVTLTEFIDDVDPIKLYKFKVKNNDNKKHSILIKYWINPNLGTFEDKTSRYILFNNDKENNLILLNNKYNKYFSNQNVFMSSTEHITDVNLTRILYKQIEVKVDFNVGEEKEFAFMLGSTEEDHVKLKTKYDKINKVNKSLIRAKEYWKKELNVINVETCDKSFDYMINGWYQYQTLSSRINAKAGFYQVSGAFGFRDQLQDTMNLATTHPDLVRNQLLNNARHQFKEGDVMHWWHDDVNIGLRTKYTDDYLWMIYAASEYIEKTGDLSILDEEVPFVEGPELTSNQHEVGMPIVFSSYTASLYDHLHLALTRSMNDLGTNGIPHMGGGDWNDGMNNIGINGKGTSVWLGFFLYYMNEKFMNITKQYKKSIDLTPYIRFNILLKESLHKNAWDKTYYLRAFFDNGNKLGSIDNKECEIDLISQSFSILTDVATDKQKPSIFDAVEEKLVDKDTKIIKLLTPPFKNSSDNPGYIMRYPKGIRENGGQYTHSVSWYLMALIKEGYKDRAYEYYQMINPINRTLDNELINKYQVEPYVIAADIYSNEHFKGHGGWTWYSGSSGWFYKVGIIDILGFNKQGNKLYIKPNVPSTWTDYKLSYNYGNTKYNMLIKLNQDKDEIIIDNKKSKNDYIELVEDEKEHDVIISIKGE